MGIVFQENILIGIADGWDIRLTVNTELELFIDSFNLIA